MVLLMLPQANPSHDSAQWKGITELFNDFQSHQLHTHGASKAASPFLGKAGVITDQCEISCLSPCPAVETTPPGIVSCGVITQTERSGINESMFPGLWGLSRRGMVWLAWPGVRPRQESNEKHLKAGRDAGSFFLITACFVGSFSTQAYSTEQTQSKVNDKSI